MTVIFIIIILIGIIIFQRGQINYLKNNKKMNDFLSSQHSD